MLLRLQAAKLKLAHRRRLGPLLVPPIEFIEVCMTGGLRVALARAAMRLGWVSRRPPVIREEVSRTPAQDRRHLVFPPMASPAAVSIVIPVFNNAAFTYGCLESIADRTPAGQYEVIVVDNGSTDETRQLLGTFAGAHVIHNDVNEGFVRGCNQGIEAATGEFVLFLNNDTVVLDGWLEHLRETIARDRRIGAVGAQLIYPDDRLQEAGGIIWNDGTGWNYGKGEDRNQPEYNFVRDVDYCSGACLLVRHSLLKILNGFDMRFAPAYYEDADLCFELRRLGFRVVYQPRAKVVHFEGATAGVDLRTGSKRFQDINRAKFLAKHRGELANQSAPDPANLFRARNRKTGKRIAVVDHMVPRPDHDAGSVRMQAMLEILMGLGHAITFIPDNLAPFAPYTESLQQLGIEVIYGSRSIHRYLLDHLRDFDIIILCRLNFAIKYLPAIVKSPHRPRVIFDTVDLHYLRERRRAELENDDEQASLAASTRDGELYLAKAADQVWVTSTHEADVLFAEDPTLRVEVVPTIHRRTSARASFDDRRDLLFVGGFRHPPNEDAVRYFARDILPLIRLQQPDARFIVVGPDPPASVLDLQSDAIVVTGHLEDLEPVLDGCRVMVAPLRYGAGLKGKVGQSLAHGLPVVTTSIGSEGLRLEDRRHALIADDPAVFASRVCELYENRTLWEHLSGEGRHHIEQHFGYDSVTARIAQALTHLDDSAGASS